MRKFLNQRQKNAAQAETRRAKIAGEGLYLFQNMTRATVILGKPCKDGRTQIEPMARFEGDSFFKNLKECVCLATLVDPNQAVEEEACEPEHTIMEATQNMAEQKLITEQPPTVTKDGKVEYVQQPDDQQQYNESQPTPATTPAPRGKRKDVLLSESPTGSVRVMR